VPEFSTKGKDPSSHRRFNDRRKRLIALVACLCVLGGLVSLTQNAELINRPSRSFVGDVAFSPDGNRLAWTAERSGEGRIVVWDLNHDRQRLRIGPRDSEPKSITVSAYTSVVFSPDGRTIATGARSTFASDPRMILWDSETGFTKQILKGHSDAVFAAAFSPDGGTLATASRDRTAKLWDVNSGRDRATLSAGSAAVTAIVFSPDGRLLATGWTDRCLRLWDVVSGHLSATLPAHTKTVTCVAISPDGRFMASASFDGTLRLWDLETRQERSTAEGFPNTCRSIAFSPDGKTLAIKFAETSTGAFWDVIAGRVTATFPNAVAGLAYAPDGKTLAVGGGAQGRAFLIEVPAQVTPRQLRTNPN
jgi:WD40 repeat protein